VACGLNAIVREDEADVTAQGRVLLEPAQGWSEGDKSDSDSDSTLQQCHVGQGYGEGSM
jgi:hypothetical protein